MQHARNYNLVVYVFALLLINLVVPPTLFHLFVPACLSCYLFVYQLWIRFNLVVGNLPSPLDQRSMPKIEICSRREALLFWNQSVCPCTFCVRLHKLGVLFVCMASTQTQAWQSYVLTDGSFTCNTHLQLNLRLPSCALLTSESCQSAVCREQRRVWSFYVHVC